MTSFNADYQEILLLLQLTEATMTQNFKIIREILDRMKKTYECRIQNVNENGEIWP